MDMANSEKAKDGQPEPQFHKSGRPRLGFIGAQGAQDKAEIEKVAKKAQEKEKGKQPAYRIGAVEEVPANTQATNTKGVPSAMVQAILNNPNNATQIREINKMRVKVGLTPLIPTCPEYNCNMVLGG